MIDGKRTTFYKIESAGTLTRHYKNLWFLNDELVKYRTTDNKTNTVLIYVYDRHIDIQVPLQHWLKYRKMAFTSSEFAYLLRYGQQQMYILLNDLRKRHIIPDPKYPSLTDVNKRTHNGAMYSEDTLFEVRKYLIDLYAKPRKDGTYGGHHIPEQELSAMIGKSNMLYTQTPEGKMVPVWRAL